MQRGSFHPGVTSIALDQKTQNFNPHPIADRSRTRREGGAVERVGCWISAASWVGRRRWRLILEDISQFVDDIGDVDHPIVVDVTSIEATTRSIIEEEIQEMDGIGNVTTAISIGITSDEDLDHQLARDVDRVQLVATLFKIFAVNYQFELDGVPRGDTTDGGGQGAGRIVQYATGQGEVVGIEGHRGR